MAEQPGCSALDDVAVVALGDGLEQAGDLGLRRSLLSGGLGLLLVSSLGEETRGNHQSQKELIAVVGSEHEVSGAARDFLASLVLGSCEDSVAHNGAEAIDLSSKLDLDGLAGLDLGGGLGLIGRQRRVGSDVGGGRDGRRVGEALRSVSNRNSMLRKALTDPC